MKKGRSFLSDKGDKQVLGAVSPHPNPSHPQTRLCFSSSRQDTIHHQAKLIIFQGEKPHSIQTTTGTTLVKTFQRATKSTVSSCKSLEVWSLKKNDTKLLCTLRALLTIHYVNNRLHFTDYTPSKPSILYNNLSHPAFISSECQRQGSQSLDYRQNGKRRSKSGVDGMLPADVQLGPCKGNARLPNATSGAL